jgi:hypothetical protein
MSFEIGAGSGSGGIPGETGPELGGIFFDPSGGSPLGDVLVTLDSVGSQFSGSGRGIIVGGVEAGVTGTLTDGHIEIIGGSGTRSVECPFGQSRFTFAGSLTVLP